MKECLECGEMVGSDEDECPECGGTEFEYKNDSLFDVLLRPFEEGSEEMLP